MSLTRWQAILLATAIVIVPILSCSQRSLVLVTVNAPQGVTYTDVSLIITATGVEQTTFSKASFTDGVYKAGVYLPSDMSGKVGFSAAVDQNFCEVAKGGPVDSPDVSSGATVSLTIGLMPEDCVPVDGGAGSSGTGGATGSGGSGAGGARGTGGVTTGTGGITTGSGGVVGSGGAVGAGGVVGTGGVVSSGGVVGTGGLVGSGGHGGSATGGAIGSGGVISTGGVIGSGGFVGSGGIVGSGGGGGNGGSASGGTFGTGGIVGSGGSSGCACPANYVCQPGTTTCICSQSDTAACSGVPCGTVTNICQQSVTCPNTCPTTGYYCDTTLDTCNKLVVTGCGGSVSTGTGLVAGTAAAPICPVN